MPWSRRLKIAGLALTGMFVAALLIGLPSIFPAWRWTDVHKTNLPSLSHEGAGPGTVFKGEDDTPIDFSLRLKLRLQGSSIDTPILRMGSRAQAILLRQAGNKVYFVFAGRQISVQAFHDLAYGKDYQLQIQFVDRGKWLGDIQPVENNTLQLPENYTPGFRSTHAFEYTDTQAQLRLDEVQLGSAADDIEKFTGSVEILNWPVTFAKERSSWLSVVQPLRIFAIFALIISFIIFLRQVGRDGWSPNRKVQLLTSVILLGFMASVIIHFIKGMYFGLPYPDNSPLFLPGFQLGDYAFDHDRIAGLDPYSGPGNYPPFLYLFMYPIAHLIGDFRIEILLLSTVFVVSFIALSMSLLPATSRLESFRNAFILVVFSYPVQFMIDRGNLDLVMYPFVFWSLLALYRQKPLRGLTGLVIASAMKPTPIIYFVLLFQRPRWRNFLKQISLAAAAIAGLTVIAAFFLETGLLGSMERFLHNLTGIYSRFTLYDISAYGGQSIKGMIRILDFVFLDPVYVTTPQGWHGFYQIVSLLLSLLVLAWVFLFNERMRFWQKIIFLTIPLLVLPFFSPNYRLVLILIGTMFFLPTRNGLPATSVTPCYWRCC